MAGVSGVEEEDSLDKRLFVDWLFVDGGDCSSNGAGEDDELELDKGCRSVVCSSRTWARLVVLTSEGLSLDCGSTIGARLIGCRLWDLL
jgi:hypothetical protein